MSTTSPNTYQILKKNTAPPKWVPFVSLTDRLMRGTFPPRSKTTYGLYSSLPPSSEYPKNFLESPGGIILIKKSGGKLNVWYIVGAIMVSFPNIRMAQFELSILKNKSEKLLFARVLVLHHPSLNRALSLTFSMDVGGIVVYGQISSDIGSGNLVQSVKVLSP